MRRFPGLLSRAWKGAAAALVCAGLIACATPTPYAPAAATDAYGFGEQPIEANRVTVSFRGNSLTSRETVETYLLYRAAEVTLDKGFDHFIVADRATDAKTQQVTVGDPFYRGFSPRIWVYSPRFGWRSYYDPFYDPFWHSRLETREITRFEARAEIAMFKGPKPADNAQAFDAREVQTNLAAKIQRPDPA